MSTNKIIKYLLLYFPYDIIKPYRICIQKQFLYKSVVECLLYLDIVLVQHLTHSIYNLHINLRLGSLNIHLIVV